MTSEVNLVTLSCRLELQFSVTSRMHSAMNNQSDDVEALRRRAFQQVRALSSPCEQQNII